MGIVGNLLTSSNARRDVKNVMSMRERHGTFESVLLRYQRFFCSEPDNLDMKFAAFSASNKYINNYKELCITIGFLAIKKYEGTTEEQIKVWNRMEDINAAELHKQLLNAGIDYQEVDGIDNISTIALHDLWVQYVYSFGEDDLPDLPKYTQG